MASPAVMNESLVTRMVNDLVTQRRIPSFRSRYAAPARLSEPNEAGKQGWSPDSIRKGSRWEDGASRSQFNQHRLSEGLRWHRNALHPKSESPRLDQIGSSVAEASRFHSPQRFNSAGLFGPGMDQAAGRENLRRPFLHRRPCRRWTVAPFGPRAFPGGPGLLS